MKISSAPLSIQKFNLLKGAFIAQGTSFSKWCHNNSVTPSNARAALIGSWDGPKAKMLRAKLIQESGISTEDN
ncbi:MULTISPECIES: hypothetical protein [Vibrio]|uniref:Uncharacterized protein n=1 Tax=Vibrio artabrorum TaxID=446374 RepID=A0ABT8CIQ0_9VIBR|nr:MULTISPECIES: hypothetical protein [Vibrio]MDN3701601.1 hypothetical protein [Vibrio artabrorum]MEC7309580.1 hypothetical protein [Vibrio crassostreae]OEF63103.1 hypothetical protein A152_22155 [Vibrio tasmaniensis 1F-187]OEF79177.1 hypothetical protein A162_15715 [Vibrio tasmaniensis 1F-155]PMO79898.1 hypothetical protein BCT01_09805 [Vibrio tasmaniensis]